MANSRSRLAPRVSSSSAMLTAEISVTRLTAAISIQSRPRFDPTSCSWKVRARSVWRIRASPPEPST
jgi:hypothetical protein